MLRFFGNGWILFRFEVWRFLNKAYIYLFSRMGGALFFLVGVSGGGVAHI